MVWLRCVDWLASVLSPEIVLHLGDRKYLGDSRYTMPVETCRFCRPSWQSLTPVLGIRATGPWQCLVRLHKQRLRLFEHCF